MSSCTSALSLTLAKYEEAHSHVDEDPRKPKKLHQVINKQKACFEADKPWKIFKECENIS